ncbi:hypothetical protein [Geobacter sp.]|uniref:hypothetical protein n=1 Tax=Geobacter sp. TaxID=46610 RepID=UPI0027BA100F|nr:hypothetical protein [Geobacter sp.]
MEWMLSDMVRPRRGNISGECLWIKDRLGGGLIRGDYKAGMWRRMREVVDDYPWHKLKGMGGLAVKVSDGGFSWVVFRLPFQTGIQDVT